MKRVLMAAVIICVVLFVVGCGNNSPSGVARSFITAVEKGDTRAIANTSTAETAQMIAMMGDKAKGAASANGRITNTTEQITGNTAIVNVTFANGEKTDITLVKVGNDWKVAMDK